MTDRMQQISLRRFRDRIDEISEPVEVSRRDAEGNINILGFWTPYPPGTQLLDLGPGRTRVLDLPIDVERPRVIRSPEEAAIAVPVHPVRAVPKPSQRRKR